MANKNANRLPSTEKNHRVLRRQFGLVGTMLAGAICLAFAIFSASAAFGNSFGRRMPTVAAELFPPNGYVQSRLATALVARSTLQANQGKAAVAPAAARDHAVYALTLEPSEGQAARTLALYHAGQGDTEIAEAIMLAANKLSRRDSVVNLWLAERFLEKGDLANGIAMMDATLRTDTRAGALLLPRLAQLLRIPDAEQHLLPMLDSNPPWLQDFWSAALQDGSAPKQAGRLRSRLDDRGIQLPPGQDALLIRQLVEAKEFEDAFRLYRQLRPANYEGSVSYSPIEWLMISTPTYGSSLDAESSRMTVSGLSGAEGVIAQRLVRIEKGKYSLMVDANTGLERLAATLICAEAAGKQTFEQSFLLAEGRSFDFMNESICNYAWLTLILLPDQQRRDVDIIIKDVAIKHEETLLHSVIGS